MFDCRFTIVKDRFDVAQYEVSWEELSESGDKGGCRSREEGGGRY